MKKSKPKGIARKLSKAKKSLPPRSHKLYKKKGLPDFLFIRPGRKPITGWTYYQKGDLRLPMVPTTFPEGEGQVKKAQQESMTTVVAPPYQIALWGLMAKDEHERMSEEARQESMTTVMKAPIDMQYPAGLLMKALISGDHVLFHEISEAMQFLQKECIHMGPGGVIEAERLGNSTQIYILDNWERWEASRAPVKERLDDLKNNRMTTTRRTYYRIVEQSGLVSDEAPPV